MEATIGGTRRHLVDVARGQMQRGLEVHLAVATTRDPDFSPDLLELEREGARVTRLAMVREIRPGRDVGDWRRLAQLMKRAQPDIVHTHSSKAGVLGRVASLSTGIGRRVHTPHTFAFLFEALFGAGKRRLFRTVETFLARRTDRIIAVSPTEAETFEASGVVPPGRIRVVPNGIDPARFADLAALDFGALGLDPARPTAAVIGLVYPAKGQDLALEVLARSGCEDLQLLVVGPGDAGLLEAQAHRLGVDSRVRFLGPRRDVPAILAGLDFLILPSRWEGMPYIVLEAMASGVPVVATPVDGARDLLVDGESGFVAEAITAEALHGSVRRMLALAPDARKALGARGRARLTDTYSIDRMVSGLLDVYAELA